MRILFAGDSITEGFPGLSYVQQLEERFPQHEIVNMGRRNDTVHSLYVRLMSVSEREKFDLAFIWVGVNDVRGPRHWSFDVAQKLIRKRRSPDGESFERIYDLLLDLVHPHAARIVAVAPMLKGEDLNNPYNSKLQCYSDIIEKLTQGYDQCRFLDIRRAFQKELTGKPISPYLTLMAIHAVRDGLVLRGAANVDHAAHKRGLHLTFDGIHLNSRGVEIVADAFSEVIEGELSVDYGG